MSQYEPREGHHHHHHRENEYGAQQGGYGNTATVGQAGGYSEGAYGGGQPAAQTAPTDQGVASANKDLRRHKHEEEGAGLGGLAAGAYALYEGHEAKKDPEHARRHKLEEEIAGTGAVGAEGLALYEHHKDHKDKKQLEEETGKKKHHGFFG